MWLALKELVHEMGLPKWLLHALLAVMSIGGGYMAAEIKAGRAVRESQVSRLIEQDFPKAVSDIAVLQIQVAALNGSQERIERKVDKMTDDVAQTRQDVAEIKALLRRMR